MSEFDVFNVPVKIQTLCYLQRLNAAGEVEILLGKHHKQGKWNGFGGKVGDKAEFKNETLAESVVREGLEELQIKALNPEKRAEVLFNFKDEKGDEYSVRCYVFFVTKWEGEITGSSEVETPTWFTIDKIPWDLMWPVDQIWLKELLSHNGFLQAEFKFDPGAGLLPIEKKMEWK